MKYRAGIDIGGTFTDIVLAAEDGIVHAEKILTTPDDFGQGIATGLSNLLSRIGVGVEKLDYIVHGTTVATNTVLESKGAITGLITTEGFRDILELRRLRIPEMYTLNWPKPPPLVPRRLRTEAKEKIGPDGEIRIPLDEQSVVVACERLAAEGVTSIAIAYLHSYANPVHEQRTAAIVREIAGADVFITSSNDILPEIREYERTSTTVINAYLGPILSAYFQSLRKHLKHIGINAPIKVMKSDGGIMSVSAAEEKPAYIVESGPAAGVIGASRTQAAKNCITLDMGGTTAKASIVENGQVSRTGDYEVGAGINLASKLVMGGGYALKLPVIDISEIGAGGGSIVSVDRGGLVKVGPQSAGAFPGPACYNLGGSEPTFTDAALALGFINPGHLVGGNLELDSTKALTSLEKNIATPLGKSLAETSWGIFQIACGSMVRAVKAVSTYRGRDPRDFSLFAFGGNGPVVAAEIANLLEMTHVIIPPNPGVFSAYGLLLSDVEHEISRAWLKQLTAVTPEEMASEIGIIRKNLAELMSREGYTAEDYEMTYLADLRYTGQAHELTIPLDTDDMLPDFKKLTSEFGIEHERNYGHKAEAENVECVTLRVIGRIIEDRAQLRSSSQAEETTDSVFRAVFFGPEYGEYQTPVINRLNLKYPQSGPLIVEEYDSTCVVPPGWSALSDTSGNIILTKET